MLHGCALLERPSIAYTPDEYMLRIAEQYFACGNQPFLSRNTEAYDDFLEAWASYAAWCECQRTAMRLIKELNDEVSDN